MKARAERTRPDHIAQLIAFLGTDAAAGVSGQIFGVRGNEVYLYNQPRPIRIMARTGWLDAGEAGRALAAGGEEQLHAAGADARRISLGSGIDPHPPRLRLRPLPRAGEVRLSGE